MPLYRVQVSLAMASGVPKDRSTNTFHVIANDVTALGVALVSFKAFYTAVDEVLSNLVASTGHTIKCYDLADPEPRAPVLEDTLGTLTTSGAPLPPEVAICCSYQAQRQSGVPQARRRGRFYLGPIAVSQVATSGRIHSATLTVVSNALQNLVDASEATSSWGWAVYSRVNGSAIEIDNAWIDDEFDIQRRRGRLPTTRISVT